MLRAGRSGLAAALVLSGLVIILRILLGPFDSPLQVRTPLNAEGGFGLALSILLATKDAD